MDAVKRETLDLLLGLGALVLGIGLLLFTFTQAFALAMNPGPWFESQLPGSVTERPPTASFSWSLNGYELTVTDLSTEGSVPITSWDWQWGDGTSSNGRNPPVHTYASDGQRTVILTVRDANGREARSGAGFFVNATSSDGGLSQTDPGGLEINFNFSDIILPLAIAILTFTLYLVMAVAGGAITKAGWNMLKPRPETIKVRLKPKHLTQAMEEDAAHAAAPMPASPIPPPPPPPT